MFEISPSELAVQQFIQKTSCYFTTDVRIIYIYTSSGSLHVGHFIWVTACGSLHVGHCMWVTAHVGHLASCGSHALHMHLSLDVFDVSKLIHEVIHEVCLYSCLARVHAVGQLIQSS